MKRLEWLDSLRGIAAFMVLIMHLWERLISYFPTWSFSGKQALGFVIEDFLNFGKVGIVVFFVVSGFVIPFSMDNKSIGTFVKTRFFRLYPAYWFSIIMFLLVKPMPHLLNLLANITMFQKFVGIPDLNGVYWTLQIELIFYFICIVLYKYHLLRDWKFICKLTYSILAVALLMAAARFHFDKKLPVALPLALSLMFIGLIIRRKFIEKEAISNKKFTEILIVFLLALIPICFLAYNKDYGFHETWYKYFVSYVIGIGFFMLFLVYKWSNRFTDFWGRISYSLYLLHPIIGLDLAFLLYKKHIIVTGPLSYALFAVCASVISAVTCFYLVEKPCVKVGKMFVTKK